MLMLLWSMTRKEKVRGGSGESVQGESEGSEKKDGGLCVSRCLWEASCGLANILSAFWRLRT